MGYKSLGLQSRRWQWFKYIDIFKIHKGKRLTKQEQFEGSIPYVSSTNLNNGIDNYIGNGVTHKKPFITIACYGSIGQAFYQSRDSWVSDNCNVLYLKKNTVNQYIGCFLVSLINLELYRYSYGFTGKLARLKERKIKLPITQEGRPDWQFMEDYIKKCCKSVDNNALNKNPFHKKKADLKDRNWKWFDYSSVFDIKNGYYNKKPKYTEQGNIPFIGATNNNNGVTGYYSEYDIETNNKDSRSADHPLEYKVFKGNCITVSNDGSVGYAFYQPKDFTCSHSVNPISIKDKTMKMNPFIAMFLCSIIKVERFRWTYGRKWRPSRMPSSKIKLPINKEGKPDWQFMEYYIKSLPYSSNLRENREKKTQYEEP